jgi:hypothetical protein
MVFKKEDLMVFNKCLLANGKNKNHGTVPGLRVLNIMVVSSCLLGSAVARGSSFIRGFVFGSQGCSYLSCKSLKEIAVT